MLDFTSSLYLGLRHGTRSLRPWSSLTTGAPAVLRPPPGAREVARELAALQGCEDGTLAPSTLHLSWDLFGLLAPRAVLHVDAGAYPVARWGVERARGRGAPVRVFAHHDPEALRKALRRGAERGRRPVVVADGLCPGCGGPAPLAEYLEAVRERGGLLVVDDTQALGVLGESPGPGRPYGRGGGGSLRRGGIEGPGVVVIASLAKGLGVPGAVLAGSAALVRGFEERSQTRVHCSPPSAAVVHAAARALEVNARCGETLRRRLAERVGRFRERLAGEGIVPAGGLFPVQTVGEAGGVDAARLHERLLAEGIRTVLHRDRTGTRPGLSFLITAAHTSTDVARAAAALAAAARTQENRRPAWTSDTRSRCSAVTTA